MLKSKQKEAVKLLWEGYKIKEIANLLHVHRSTLWRWWQNTEMRQYTEHYCKRETQKILNRPIKSRLFDDLHSPNAERSYMAASKILSLYTDIIMYD